MTADGILTFLESQMNDSSKFNAVPHLLLESNLAFRLSGREAALSSAATCMKNMSDDANLKSKDKRRIPVCSGISGLGKTRMLEEWEYIFNLAGINGPRLGCFVMYNNGCNPVAEELSMTMDASFSWRLLHRLFLYGNCDSTFSHWVSNILPSNCQKLTLTTALDVIRKKAVNLSICEQNDILHLFIGIDEYQSIRKYKALHIPPQTDDWGELIQNLLDVLNNAIAAPSKGIRIFPMFAGTDFSKISFVNSSRGGVKRLPMLLLSPMEVANAVASVDRGDSLLMLSPVRRYLFYLGGVPRWCFQYISLLLDKMEETKQDVLPIEIIEGAFASIRCDYVDRCWDSLNPVDYIKFAAYSVSGISVNMSDSVGHTKWSVARDTSLCLINDFSQVFIPYAIFHFIAKITPGSTYSDAEKCFIHCVKGLINKVDSLMYEKPLWALWEVFGAYFHALRINSMIIVGRPVLQLSELFTGALVRGCDVEVELLPTTVIQCDQNYRKDISATIGRRGYSLEKHNWLDEGLVVINGENGKGVDIFFSLKKHADIGHIVCLDQRKRVAGPNLGEQSISNLLASTSILPTSLEEHYGPITVVPLLFSCLRTTNIDELNVENGVVVTYNQTKVYHSGLWIHPASSPCVNVNTDPVSYISMVLSGPPKDVQTVASTLANQEQRRFTSIEGFREAVQNICANVNLFTEERIVFS